MTLAAAVNLLYDVYNIKTCKVHGEQAPSIDPLCGRASPDCARPSKLFGPIVPILAMLAIRPSQPEGPSARKDVMSNLAKPSYKPAPVLTDPRSTGAGPKPRLPDIQGLRGTKPS